MKAAGWYIKTAVKIPDISKIYAKLNCVIMNVEDSYRHRGLRKKLLKTLEDKGIRDDAVLRAIGTVPRHFFFEQAFLEHAYEDKAFPIGEGQTISQPYTVAFQTELLNITPGDTVLEIGTGSGYQCCVLAEMGALVYTVELNKVLHRKARMYLNQLGYKAMFKLGDGTAGWETFAPYDKILVTAGAPHIPAALLEQLRCPGILVIPVGGRDHQKMLRIIKDASGTVREEEHDFFRFVPLVGKDGWKENR
jgi:protein-L-isoaspartate(D-aspartate) O-methyltransferase